MERLMTHVANGLLHFGWAVVGQQCADDCVWPRFNGMARLMAGISNKLYGLPWHENDWTDMDEARSDDAPMHAMDRVGMWVHGKCQRAATYLNEKYNERLL
tara:strand:+ start:72 stop:374 length:303 start_codon:yes stop_codon:yes gene_type:complete